MIGPKRDVYTVNGVDPNGIEYSVDYHFELTSNNGNNTACLKSINIFPTSASVDELIIPQFVYGNKDSIKYEIIAIGGDILAYVPYSQINKLVIADSIRLIAARAFANLNAKTVVWPKACKSLPSNVFYGAKIEEIQGIEEVTDIANCAFIACSHLKHITWPTNCSVINPSTFANCLELSSVDNINNVKEIKMRAFYSTAIKQVVIPSTCNKIEALAFASCDDLEIIKFEPAENIEVASNALIHSDKVIFDASQRTYISVPRTGLNTIKEVLGKRYIESFYGFPIEATN